MSRHIFSGSKTNRDRRDQSFARSIIATAEQKRREAEADAREAIAREACVWCGAALPDDRHWPYCSVSCGVQAEAD